MVHKAKSTVKASVSDGAPRLRAEITAECAVIGVKGNLDVSKPENEATVQNMAEDKLASFCRQALEKAQKELKTDIFVSARRSTPNTRLIGKASRTAERCLFRSAGRRRSGRSK